MCEQTCWYSKNKLTKSTVNIPSILLCKSMVAYGVQIKPIAILYMQISIINPIKIYFFYIIIFQFFNVFNFVTPHNLDVVHVYTGPTVSECKPTRQSWGDTRPLCTQGCGNLKHQPYQYTKLKIYTAEKYTYGTKQSKKFSCTREASVNSLKTLLGPIAASGFSLEGFPADLRTLPILRDLHHRPPAK